MSEIQMKRDYNKILVLAKDGGHRTNIAKSLKNAGFSVDFISTTNDLMDSMKNFGSGIFIHDYESTDKSQGDLLQQRLAKLDEFSTVIRIILAKEITPKLLAIASDTQIKRIVPYSSLMSTFGDELKMISKSDSSIGEMQRKIKALKTPPGAALQKETDKIIEETYKSFKHDPSVRIEFGGVLIRRNEIKEAQMIGEDVLKMEPNNVRAMSLISRSLMKKGKFKEALKIMENANALAPGNTARLIELGDAFFKNGQNDKAKAALNQAKAQDPKGSSDADKVLGQIALTEGDSQAAFELFVNSCSEDESAGFFNNSAVHASRSGKRSQALELYQTALKALKTNRLKPAVYYNIALTYMQLDQYKEALKAITSATKFDKDHKKSAKLKAKIEKHLSSATIGTKKVS